MEPLFGLLFSVSRGTPKHGEWVIVCLQGAWPKLIGDRLAAVCTPASFDGSTLVIETRDRQWKEAIAGVEPALLEKLRRATGGEVKRIRIMIGQSTVPESPVPVPVD